MLDYSASIVEAFSELEDRIAARDLQEREAEFDGEPDVDLLYDLLRERKYELEIERQSAQLPPRPNNGGDANPGHKSHPSGKGNRIAPEPASDIDTRTVTVTFFPNKSAQSQRCIDLTLPQLAEQIRLKTGPSKLELPWLKLMTFGNTRSTKGCLRTNANAQQITGIEVEHDKGEVSLRHRNCSATHGQAPCAGLHITQLRARYQGTMAHPIAGVEQPAVGHARSAGGAG